MGDVCATARIVVADLRVGARSLRIGGGAAGRVSTPVGGIVGRFGAMGAWGARGAALILYDRCRREALIGESLLSSGEEVGRLATINCTVASWVVTVLTSFVIASSALSEEEMNAIRMDSPSDRSLSCPLSGMGI